jgi:pyridoxine 5'-phosphate synthase
MKAPPLRLGVNIDHVATVRNARGGAHPDPIRAANLAVLAGADGITAHLREDRRHIRDEDMRRLKQELFVPLNFEMAATSEMVEMALRLHPHASCLVPEKREERTTEGGLDIVGGHAHLRPIIRELKGRGIRVSLFVEPETEVMDAACDLGAPVVELHTGTYDAQQHTRRAPRIVDAIGAPARGRSLPHAATATGPRIIVAARAAARTWAGNTSPAGAHRGASRRGRGRREWRDTRRRYRPGPGR